MVVLLDRTPTKHPQQQVTPPSFSRYSYNIKIVNEDTAIINYFRYY